MGGGCKTAALEQPTSSSRGGESGDDSKNEDDSDGSDGSGRGEDAGGEDGGRDFGGSAAGCDESEGRGVKGRKGEGAGTCSGVGLGGSVVVALGGVVATTGFASSSASSCSTVSRNDEKKLIVVGSTGYSSAASQKTEEAGWVTKARRSVFVFLTRVSVVFLAVPCCNTSDKPLPAPAVVQARMKEIQTEIDAGPVGGQPLGQSQGYALNDILSADETASHHTEKLINH